MRVRPWLEPRSWSSPNCSCTVTSAPRSRSAHAVAQPITPAPTTAPRLTRVSLPERPGDLPANRLPGLAQVDLTRRASEFASVLVRPSRDRIVGAEDRRERGVFVVDSDERDLAGAQFVLSTRPRDADLHRPVVRLVDPPVE